MLSQSCLYTASVRFRTVRTISSPFGAGRSWIKLLLGLINLVSAPSVELNPLQLGSGLSSATPVRSFPEFTQFIPFYSNYMRIGFVRQVPLEYGDTFYPLGSELTKTYVTSTRSKPQIRGNHTRG